MTQPKGKDDGGLMGFLESLDKTDEHPHGTPRYVHRRVGEGPVYVCTDCGCLVADIDLHDMFHIRIEPVGPLGDRHR